MWFSRLSNGSEENHMNNVKAIILYKLLCFISNYFFYKSTFLGVSVWSLLGNSQTRRKPFQSCVWRCPSGYGFFFYWWGETLIAFVSASERSCEFKMVMPRPVEVVQRTCRVVTVTVGCVQQTFSRSFLRQNLKLRKIILYISSLFRQICYFAYSHDFVRFSVCLCIYMCVCATFMKCVCVCVCVLLSWSSGCILAKIKNVKNAIHRFWYLSTNGTIAKVVLCDIGILFKVKYFKC